MNTKLLLSVSIVLFVCVGVRADDKDDHKAPPPRKVCFNVFCTYDARDQHGQDQYEKCHAGSTFTKWVRDDGDEIQDESADHDDDPKFEVECDGKPVYNNSAHRYTDWQGTRIQALQGPYPAIVLPEGALKDTHEYAVSALELWDQTLHGYCYVYTGPQ